MLHASTGLALLVLVSMKTYCALSHSTPGLALRQKWEPKHRHPHLQMQRDNELSVARYKTAPAALASFIQLLLRVIWAYDHLLGDRVP
mmetsp:Transcript_7219/g.45033  ORF Transcript_7219/g.45033 Transcript_7219/m.45033 type:complete len:88 (-) Transcript_7219:1039-1302(-)